MTTAVKQRLKLRLKSGRGRQAMQRTSTDMHQKPPLLQQARSKVASAMHVDEFTSLRNMVQQLKSSHVQQQQKGKEMTAALQKLDVEMKGKCQLKIIMQEISNVLTAFDAESELQKNDLNTVVSELLGMSKVLSERIMEFTEAAHSVPLAVEKARLFLKSLFLFLEEIDATVAQITLDMGQQQRAIEAVAYEWNRVWEKQEHFDTLQSRLFEAIGVLNDAVEQIKYEMTRTESDMVLQCKRLNTAKAETADAEARLISMKKLHQKVKNDASEHLREAKKRHEHLEAKALLLMQDCCTHETQIHQKLEEIGSVERALRCLCEHERSLNEEKETMTAALQEWIDSTENESLKLKGLLEEKSQTLAALDDTDLLIHHVVLEAKQYRASVKEKNDDLKHTLDAVQQEEQKLGSEKSALQESMSALEDVQQSVRALLEQEEHLQGMLERLGEEKQEMERRLDIEFDNRSRSYRLTVEQKREDFRLHKKNMKSRFKNELLRMSSRKQEEVAHHDVYRTKPRKKEEWTQDDLYEYQKLSIESSNSSHGPKLQSEAPNTWRMLRKKNRAASFPQSKPKHSSSQALSVFDFCG